MEEVLWSGLFGRLGVSEQPLSLEQRLHCSAVSGDCSFLPWDFGPRTRHVSKRTMQCKRNRGSSNLNLSFLPVYYTEEGAQRIEVLGRCCSKLLVLLSSIPLSFLTTPFQGLQTCAHVHSLWNLNSSHKRSFYPFGSLSYLVNPRYLLPMELALLAPEGMVWGKI